MTSYTPRLLSLMLSLGILSAAIGCGSSATKSPPPKTDSGSEDDSQGDSDSASAADEEAKPFVLGDLIEPFDPPTLEELEANVTWSESPVRDEMDVMREYLATQPEPTITVKQALEMRNDSPEDNEKMLRALGQLAADDNSGVNYDSTIVRHVGGDLKSVNPLLQSSVTEFEYQDLCSIGLISFDRNFNYFGDADIVESWQTSEDRMIDRFKIRKDLTWSDGKPVTAHDFEYTFRVIMTDAVIVPAIRQHVQEMKLIKAYDDYTLVVFHKEPLATNRENMIYPILPQHIYEETIPKDPTMARSEEHSRLEDNPVVAGPYQLARRKRGQEFVVSRREDYYMHEGKQVRSKPYFKEVRVKAIEDFNTAILALKAGDIEQMEIRPEQWVSQTNDASFYKMNTKVTANEWVEFHFVWNSKDPLFADSRVRWAMTYAMDYEELINTICYGLYEQSRGNFHSTSWMFPKDGPQPVKQDLDKAEELLTAAGWEDTDGDGTLDKEINGRRVPFEFTMLTYQTAVGSKTATLMKESLDLIGVVCNVKPTEFTVLTQKQRDKEFQAAMGGWGTGTDPSTNENIFGTDAGRNYGSYSNKEVDELFDAGKRETDKEKRAEIYGKIHMLMWEDQPYTWLFYRNSFYGFNKKLRGYNFSPRGPFNYSPGFGSIYAPAAQP